MHLPPDICLLCHQPGEVFYKDIFFLCSNCSGIYRDKRFFLNPEQEEKFYGTHENDVNDARYRQFVSPITHAILHSFTPEHSGLDFGAGTGPVISTVLQEEGYQIHQYDPFFHNDPTLLKKQYDYIACCEVMEHFHHPDKEFHLLKRLLNPGGSLFCMTHLYHPDVSFDNWYYKNDPTHVFLYQETTMLWIRKAFGFSNVKIEGRLIRLDT